MLHVTFSASARVSLAQAFERLGRPDEVLPLVDDLGYGPIEPGTLEQRDVFEEDIEFAPPVALKRAMREHGVDPESRRIRVSKPVITPTLYGAVPLTLSAKPA